MSRLRGGVVGGAEAVHRGQEAAEERQGVRRALRGLHGGRRAPHHQVRRHLHVPRHQVRAQRKSKFVSKQIKQEFNFLELLSHTLLIKRSCYSH